MTSQPGQQTVTTHILPDIQAIKFGQVIEDYRINIFLQKSCWKWARKTSSRPLFVFQKSFIWGKSKWLISIALNLIYNRNKLYKNLNYWSRDMLNFDFLEKGSWNTTFCVRFVYYFSRKMFFMLHSINWPNFIAWLLLVFEILVNICIANIC